MGISDVTLNEYHAIWLEVISTRNKLNEIKCAIKRFKKIDIERQFPERIEEYADLAISLIQLSPAGAHASEVEDVEKDLLEGLSKLKPDDPNADRFIRSLNRIYAARSKYGMLPGKE